jgi:hypothetical protein
MSSKPISIIRLRVNLTSQNILNLVTSQTQVHISTQTENRQITQKSVTFAFANYETVSTHIIVSICKLHLQ